MSVRIVLVKVWKDVFANSFLARRSAIPRTAMDEDDDVDEDRRDPNNRRNRKLFCLLSGL